MSNDDKIIKNKLGLINLAEKLGSVLDASKAVGYSRDGFYRFKNCTRVEGPLH